MKQEIQHRRGGSGLPGRPWGACRSPQLFSRAGGEPVPLEQVRTERRDVIQSTWQATECVCANWGIFGGYRVMNGKHMQTVHKRTFIRSRGTERLCSESRLCSRNKWTATIHPTKVSCIGRMGWDKSRWGWGRGFLQQAPENCLDLYTVCMNTFDNNK